MNETAIVYIVHSDLDENNIFAMFEDEVEAIMYARRHKEDLTYVDKTEMSLTEFGEYDEVLSAETIWVYDEDENPEDIEDVPELSDKDLFDIDFDELERELDDEESWFEDLDTDKLVETLEENEDIVECKECFELFPKEACTKIAIGYICPECGKIHSHEDSEFEIDSIPDVVIADEDTFKIDFPELERTDYGNDMIPDEPTPEVEPNPEPMAEPCVGPECEAPVEAPVTKEETITKLVVDEHEAIDGYEKAKIEIEANSELDEKEKEEILDTIEHIKEEEIEHIEELEELVDEVEETKADKPAEESEEKEILHEDDRNIFKKLVSNPDWYWKNGGTQLDLGGTPDKQRAPRQGYIVKKAAIKDGKLEISTNDSKEVKKYSEAEQVAKAESADDKSFVYIVMPKGESKSIYLVVYSKGQVLKGTESWLQNALDKKAADKNVVTKQLDWKLNITQIAVGEEKELKVLNNEDKVIRTDLYTLELVEEDTESNVEFDTTKRILKGVSKGDAEIKITKIDTKQTVVAKVTVVEVKEEPKNEVKPDQETQTTSKYKADPITATVGGKAMIIKVKDDYDNPFSTKGCTVTANKDGIVEVVQNPKNKRLAVKGLKPGKVTLTIKKEIKGEIKEVCKCEVTVKPSLEDEEKIKAAKELLTDNGYKVEDPVTESLEEHVNEEHPAVESDQKLVGADNAVVDCKVNKVIIHSKDEKPVDCNGEKKPFKKPLTESLSKDQLQAMEDYLKSTKFASLDTEWEEEGDFYLDIIGAYLDYSNRTNMFSLGLSIYHASEDNNAEYPERHTDEEEFNYDSLAEMYEDEECKEILDRIYLDNLAKLGKSLTETKCKDCGGELKNNKCTACNRDWNLEKCNRCGGEVKDGKCTHCDHDFTIDHCKDCGGEVKDGKCTSCNELVEAHRTGEFVKLVNDKFRTDQSVSVYDLKCLMKGCAVTVRQQGLSKINLIIDFDNNCEIIQETEKAYLVSVPCYFRNPKDRSQILDTPNYIAVWAPKSRCAKLDPVTEETHAQYAKPEGNRVQAFNNALKYAKKENKPFIYGYTNHTGKFFAAEQPMKVTGSPAEAEKEFRQQYKNCKVVYVVYPDKEFIREGLFTKQEQEEYNMDEDGHSLDSYDTYVRCGFCDEIYTKSECKYERNLSWLCPSCEAAIYSRGEKLTFVDPDEFLD